MGERFDVCALDTPQSDLGNYALERARDELRGWIRIIERWRERAGRSERARDI